MLDYKRKPLRLENYDYSKIGAYFVTVCLQNRGAKYLEKTETKQMIERWLLKTEEKFSNVTIDYYVIMKDHVHIIIFINEQNKTDLALIMDWFKTMTTNEYIRGVKSGIYEPFEKRFRQRSYNDHIIRNDEDLAEKRQYILNNPIKESVDA